ncbi:MAG: phosphatidylglycerophosphatase A [Verrucomicrobia bacterium]|nr:phosphatidylglycerophosphatase A [Verrucomicrobiota bacterium]
MDRQHTRAGGWTDRVAVVFASGFGLGFIPFASGTFGTLPGVALVVLLWPVLDGNLALQIATGVALTLAAVPVCGAAERFFGKKDDGRIVADEYATFPLVMIGLPVVRDEWWIVLVAFLAARFFDILKPWPARGLQRIRGGTGIVIDDVFASLYALAFTHGAVLTIRHFLA